MASLNPSTAPTAHQPHAHSGEGEGEGVILAVNPFNVAVIGYGLSAKVFHIPLILAVPDLKLYGVVQRSPQPSNDAAQDHPGIQSWRSVDDMLQDGDVDLVVITSIPSTHYDMCKAALNAGKHVVVEKPFVPSSKEADELIALAKEKERLLTVYQNRRWDADYLTLRQILSSGSLGEIAEFETHFDRHRPNAPPATWKSKDEPGNESIYDLGTHLLDQLYHSFGLPQRVTGFVGKQRRGAEAGAGSNDSFTVLLHYADGMLATAKAGVVSAQTRQLRFWVRGTGGSFHKFHLDPQEEQLKAGLRPRQQGFAEEDESHYGVLTTCGEGGVMERRVYPTLKPETYVAFYSRLVDALKDEEAAAVPVRAEDARDVLRIVEAALVSSQEGRTVVL